MPSAITPPQTIPCCHYQTFYQHLCLHILSASCLDCPDDQITPESGLHLFWGQIGRGLHLVVCQIWRMQVWVTLPFSSLSLLINHGVSLPQPAAPSKLHLGAINPILSCWPVAAEGKMQKKWAGSSRSKKVDVSRCRKLSCRCLALNCSDGTTPRLLPSLSLTPEFGTLSTGKKRELILW